MRSTKITFNILVPGMLLLILLAGELFAKGPVRYTFFLDSARVSPKPDISNNILNYSLDLYFRKRPQYFWAYYSIVDSALIVDIYGGLVKPTQIRLPSTTPFKEITIRHLETKMTLSGEQTHILVSLDTGWHIEYEPGKNESIHITLWKGAKIQKKEIKQKRSQFFYAYIAAAVAATWAVLGIVLAINKNA